MTWKITIDTTHDFQEETIEISRSSNPENRVQISVLHSDPEVCIWTTALTHQNVERLIRSLQLLL